MALFQTVYDRALIWSKHPRAPFYLGGLSFSESLFLPFPPPDVMLAPMSLAQPNHAWRFALITTLLSLVGGTVGYVLGAFAFEMVAPLIEQWGYTPVFEKTKSWFDEWGIWIVFVAGFSPIPFKVFTISAGVTSMAFLPFILTAAVARATRFFLVAGLMKWGGEALESRLRDLIDRLGWAFVIVVVLFILYKL